MTNPGGSDIDSLYLRLGGSHSQRCPDCGPASVQEAYGRERSFRGSQFIKTKSELIELG